MMYTISTIETEGKLKEVYLFVTKTFYDVYQKDHEHYFPMGERYNEMKRQFEIEKQLLYYVQNELGEIIGALTTKSYRKEKQSITLAILCVKKEYQRVGIGSSLIQRFEEDCLKLKIKTITLGARYSACNFYKKHQYQPYLMVQVYDFMNIDTVLKENSDHLKVLETYQEDYYGYVNFDVEDTKWEYVEHFKKIPTASVQYLFTKEL